MADDAGMVFVDGGESVAGDIAEALAEYVAEAERVQPGAEFGSADGIPIRARRNSSMVKFNGVELPERTKVYDRFGNEHMVPTAQLAYHLTKSNRAFTRKPPEGVRPKEWIEQGCDICAKYRVDGSPKRFTDIEDYFDHMEIKHEREWKRRQRAEERALTRPTITVADIRDAIRGLSDEEIAALRGKPVAAGRKKAG